MIDDPLFYVAALPAVALLGFAKGGFSGLGMLALPLMTLVLSPVRAAAILLPILIVQDVISVWAYRRDFDRRNLAVLLPGGVAGIAAGYGLAAYVSEAAVEFAVGLIAVVFGLRRLWLERGGREAPAHTAGPAAGVFWGAAAGFTSMIAHAGGPPFQIYVLPQRLPHAIFVGTGAMFFGLVNWLKVVPYLALGQLDRETMLTALALFPAAILTTWLGVLLVRRVRGDRFYTAVNVLLVLVGAKLILDGVTGLGGS